MDQDQAKRLHALGYEAGVKLCQSAIHYRHEGYSDMLFVHTEVPEYGLLPMGEEQRRAYMRGLANGIMHTITNE